MKLETPKNIEMRKNEKCMQMHEGRRELIVLEFQIFISRVKNYFFIVPWFYLLLPDKNYSNDSIRIRAHSRPGQIQPLSVNKVLLAHSPHLFI